MTRLLPLIIFYLCSPLAFAESHRQQRDTDVRSERREVSPFQPKAGPMERRGTIWRPALSFLLPGFDQHLAHQFAYGMSYSGIYLVSSLWADSREKKVESFESSLEYRRLNDAERDNLQVHDERYKQRTLARQLTLFSGGLSAYHSFRTAVRTHQPYGSYKFLKHEESPKEILLAPFRFDFLTRPTTILPLALITGLAILDANSRHHEYRSDPISGSDLFYTSAISYNAGTYEEAMFRGWIMPVLMEGTGSAFWSNLLQAGLFAAAHMNQITMPYAQFSLGFYLGWLTQNSEWTLAESIFIHAWWDVAALTIQYSNRKKTGTGQLPVIWLPALKLAF